VQNVNISEKSINCKNRRVSNQDKSRPKITGYCYCKCATVMKEAKILRNDL